MGFEPTISRVTRCFPSGMVGIGGAEAGRPSEASDVAAKATPDAAAILPNCDKNRRRSIAVFPFVCECLFVPYRAPEANRFKCSPRFKVLVAGD